MTRSLALLLVVAVTVYAAPVVIIDSMRECGSTYTVELDDKFRLTGRGVAAGANSTGDSMCTFSFTAATDAEGCTGLCYMFDYYAKINDEKVELAVGSTAYKEGAVLPKEPTCVDDKTLPVTLTQKTGYVYDKDNLNYKFVLSVYHKCGHQVINIDFDEAVEKLDGYHHGQAREDREKSTFIAGILLGFGLSSIFLVVLFLAWCYVRNSPNRRGRSSSNIKIGGQRGKMTPGQEPKEVEMGVRYQAKDPDRPEGKPLLDPVKPPAEGATGNRSA